MVWIKLYDTLLDHPKTIATASALKIDKDMLIGKLCRLWTWAADNRDDGFISDNEIETVAEKMRWTKKAKALMDALCIIPDGLRHECGFLIRVENGYVINDWDEHFKTLLDSREKQKEQGRNRQSRYRGRKNEQKVTRDIPVGDGAVTEKVTPCNALHERHVTDEKTPCNAPRVRVEYNYVRTSEKNGFDDELDLDGAYAKASIACGYAGIRLVSPQDEARLDKMLSDNPQAWVMEAIRRIGDKTEEKRNLGYLEGILRRWKEAGCIDADKPNQEQNESRSPPKATGIAAANGFSYGED